MVSIGVKTKAKLLGAGRTLIRERGFDGMGINELLIAANVSRGSFYHYFKSKEELGLELLKECFEECLAILKRLGGEDPIYFDDWLEQVFEESYGSFRFIAHMIAQSGSLPMGVRTALSVQNGQYVSELAVFVRKLSGGCPSECLLEAKTLYGFWMGMSLLELSQAGFNGSRIMEAVSRSVVSAEE